MDTIIANNKIRFLKSEIVKFVTNGGKIIAHSIGENKERCPIGAVWENFDETFKKSEKDIYGFFERNYGLDYNFYSAFDFFITEKEGSRFDSESENAFVAKKIAEFCIQNNFIK